MFTLCKDSRLRLRKDGNYDGCYLVHLLFSHSECRDGGSSDSEAGGVPCSVFIERKRIPVERYSALPQKALGLASVESIFRYVNQHEMVLRSSGKDRSTLFNEGGSHRRGIIDNTVSILSEFLAFSFPECNELGAHDVWKRSSDYERTALVDTLFELLPAEDHAASGAAESLVRRRSHHIRPLHRVVLVLEYLSGNEPRKMCHVYHEDGTDRVCDFAHTSEVDLPRVCRIAGKKNQRLYLLRQSFDFVVVEKTSLPVDGV